MVVKAEEEMVVVQYYHKMGLLTLEEEVVVGKDKVQINQAVMVALVLSSLPICLRSNMLYK